MKNIIENNWVSKWTPGKKEEKRCGSETAENIRRVPEKDDEYGKDFIQ